MTTNPNRLLTSPSRFGNIGGQAIAVEDRVRTDRSFSCSYSRREQIYVLALISMIIVVTIIAPVFFARTDPLTRLTHRQAAPHITTVTLDSVLNYTAKAAVTTTIENDKP